MGCDETTRSWFDLRRFLIVSVFCCLILYGLCCYLNSICSSWHGQTGVLFCFCLPLQSYKCFPNTMIWILKPKVLYIFGRLCAWRNFRHLNSALLSTCSPIFFFVCTDSRVIECYVVRMRRRVQPCSKPKWFALKDLWAKWSSLPGHLSYV